MREECTGGCRAQIKDEAHILETVVNGEACSVIGSRRHGTNIEEGTKSQTLTKIKRHRL